MDGTFKYCVNREIGDDCGLPGLSLKTKQSGNSTLRTAYIFRFRTNYKHRERIKTTVASLVLNVM